MTYQELFIDKSKTLIINTELSVILGDLNESIVLNQLNYWLEINRKADKHFIDGRYWVYNTYNDWKTENFPYWSEKTIQRTFTRLENKGIVISANYNKSGIDKTKWYTIDYDKLEEIVKDYRLREDNMSQRNDNKSIRQDKMSSPEGHNDRAIPENTTDNTNRDYNSENTEVYTLSKDNAKAYTSVSKKQLPERAKNKTKSELKELEADMIRRFDEIANQYDVTETAYKNITRAFRRYLNRYTQKTGKIHPILKDETLEKVFTALATITDTEYSHFENVADIEPDANGVSFLDDMVDEHFSVEHRGQTDYCITHFANSEYLQKLANHVVEW